MCRYAYSFGAISAGVVFIWGIPALFFYLMWHARNVNVAKQWYVGVCWGVGCTQVTFEIQLWNTKSEIWVDVAPKTGSLGESSSVYEQCFCCVF